MTALRDRYRLVALDLADLDIGDPDQCRSALDRHQPDIVLNCAAYTRVDDAESHFDIAQAVNADAPGIMAQWVDAHRAWLLHVSTDFVFDGGKPPPERYVEDDTPNPLSVYGQTKLAGENAVREQTDRHAILRTAWLYGRNGANFPKTMLRLALTQPDTDIRVVDDQIGSPTWSHRLASQIERVLSVRAQGTFHASSDSACTWYAFACAFLDAMNVPYRVIPCTTADYPTPARRPPNAVLENRALRQAGLDIMPAWQDDMMAFVRIHRDALIEETQETMAVSPDTRKN